MLKLLGAWHSTPILCIANFLWHSFCGILSAAFFLFTSESSRSPGCPNTWPTDSLQHHPAMQPKPGRAPPVVTLPHPRLHQKRRPPQTAEVWHSFTNFWTLNWRNVHLLVYVRSREDLISKLPKQSNSEEILSLWPHPACNFSRSSFPPMCNCEPSVLQAGFG